jgi:O-antigen ligase
MTMAADPPTREAACARIALLLASLVGALPFLLFEHRAPIPSFYDEWLALALGAMALAAFAFSLREGTIAVPVLTLWLLGLASSLAVQGLLREPAFPQLPLAGAVYVLAGAGLAWLGNGLSRSLGASCVADTVATVVLAGAVANAVIGIAQSYGVPQALGELVTRTQGARIVGHVGQANLFASYLALGAASAAYLFGRGRLPAWAAWPAGALLALAGAYSGSRSAIVYSLWLAALGFVTHRHAGGEWRAVMRFAALICAATCVAAIALPRVHDALGLPAIEFMVERLVDPASPSDPRPDAWALAIRIFLDSPWLGVGWGEFAGAAFRAGLPATLAAVSPVWTSPHNAPLQLLAEAGLVGGAIALIAALGWWRGAAARLRRSATLPDWWVAAVAGVVCLHALVEYPLWYAHVLVLLCFVCGMTSQPAIELAARRVRLTAATVGLLQCGLLAWGLRDYLQLDRAFLVATGSTLASAVKVEEASAALRRVSGGPLGAQAASWLHRAQSFDTDDLAAKLALGERLMRCSPAPSVVARHAAFLMLAGRSDDALRLLDHAIATLPDTVPALATTLQPLAAGAPEAIAPLLARTESARRGERR